MPRSRARAAALTALVAVESGTFLDRALRDGDRISGADERERSLARRITRGVLQTRGRIDWILERFLEKRPPSRLDSRTRNILRIGVYQVLYLSSVPSHAAVNETVRLARSNGGEPAARLVNGVLRRLLREGPPAGLPSLDEDPVRHLAVSESHPEWLVARWVTRLGPERAAARIRAGNRIPPLSLRVVDPDREDAVAAEIEGEGRKVRRSTLLSSVLVLPDGGSPAALGPFARGEVIVQDEGAAIAGSVAGPQPPGARLLDLCAAPGGKILPLASRLVGGGTAFAFDRSRWRMERLRENAARLELAPVRFAIADGLAPPFRKSVRFDLVILDVPCTGLGTLARRADLRWRTAEEDIRRLAGLASRLLRAAADLVEPGGHLVYSTCTTEPEENEQTVAHFLEKERRFRIVPPGAALPASTLRPDGMVEVLPEVHGCDGAFAARLQRIGDR